MQEEHVSSGTGIVIHTGRHRISLAGDVPLLEVIRDCTYITRPQIDLLCIKPEEQRNRNRRLAKLLMLRQIKDHGKVFPYPNKVFSITREGLLSLEITGGGILSVTSNSEILSDDQQMVHFIGLNQARIKLQSVFNITRWLTDRNLRSLNIATENTTSKDYDGVFELRNSLGKTLQIGIEYEKTIKSKERYAEIRKVLARENSINAVLYVAENESASVLLSQHVYSDKCPVAVITAGELYNRGNESNVKTVRDKRVVYVNIGDFLSSV
jgi:hypothetical protein